MANIKSDNDGFLIGEPLDLNRTYELWDDIRNDMKAIRMALSGKESGFPAFKPTLSSNTSKLSQSSPIIPLQRNEIKAPQKAPSSPSISSTHNKVIANNQILVATPQPAVSSTKQDNNTVDQTILKPAATPRNIRSREKQNQTTRDSQTGRFTKNNGKENISSANENPNHDRYIESTSASDDSSVRIAAEKIASVVSDASSGMEETDPAIKAFSEVAQPMARGYEILTSGTGREQKDTSRWFRKIFGELKLFRKEETVFNKAANKSLKGIEEKPVEGSGGAFGFLIGAGILAGGAIALLKKIPVIGALITSAGNIFDIYSGLSEDSLTNAEKNKKLSKGVGGVGGTVVGALGGAKLGALGGAMGGPITAVIGGLVGGIVGMVGGNMIGESIGETIGDWLGDTDIWKEITTTWNNAVSSISKEFSSLTGTFSSVLNGISSKIESAWNTFTGFMKDKFGINIQAGINTVKEKAVKVGTKVINAVKETTAGKAVSKEFEAAKQSRIGKATSEALENAEAATGSVLEDVMPKGYRHRATFHGIKGGDSLSKNGTYTDAEANRVRALKTSAANTSANLPGGMPQEIQDKISAQAKKHGLDPVMMLKMAAMESGGNQNAISKNGAIGVYQFTGGTASGVGINNRFDVDQNIEGAMKLTAQNIAVLKKSGLPVTAENIYMMHQLPPGSAQEIIRGSMNGKSKADLSPKTQRAMNHNYGANSRTAADYIEKNRISLDKRYAATVVASASTITPPISVVGQPQTAHAHTPEAPRISSPPQLPAEEPKIMEPLTSSGGRNKTVITSVQQEVGQDVKDRRIAHIVTGGLSN